MNRRNEADKYGIDISLIDANLSLTPTERVIFLQNALNLSNEIKKAGKKLYEGLQKSSGQVGRK
ncbi:MAG: hypothetical protein ABIE74_10530 [Pseudomonadota bacterium]